MQRGELPGDTAAETATPAPQHFTDPHTTERSEDSVEATAAETATPAPQHLTDPHTTERSEDSVEATAADTASGLGPNTQAPTLRHEMQGEH